MGNISYVNLASTLALDEIRNTTQAKTLACYMGITREDIVRVASYIFRQERSSTLIYCPNDVSPE